MNIPHKIKLKGKTFHIFFSEDLVKGKWLGEFDPNTLTIYISKRQSERAQRITLLHEIIHAISSEYELNLTERQVEGMDSPLYSIIKQLFT